MTSNRVKTVAFCPICKEQKVIKELHMKENSETAILECGHKLKHTYGELGAKVVKE